MYTPAHKRVPVNISLSLKVSSMEESFLILSCLEELLPPKKVTEQKRNRGGR
jgi:hypothetical protein